MSAIGKLVPLLVFTCILDLMLSESFSQLALLSGDMDMLDTRTLFRE